MKKEKAYTRIRKWCDVCYRYTTQVIEPMLTICTRCNCKFDDDGDDLME